MRARDGLLALALALAPLGARAGFLDSSEPAQAAAMGGNLVALPDEPSGVYYNPAALGALDQCLVSARYAQLFAGLENDNLSAGGLEAMAPLGGLGGLALGWDHFGGDFLQQDRFQLAWGREQGLGGLGQWDLGLSLAYLHQSFTLGAPLAGVNVDQMDSQAFSLGAGAAWKPWPWLVLAFAGQDINQPNMGVLGPDLVPATWRWGLGLRSGPGSWGAAELTVAQSLSLGVDQTQVGAQWEPWDLGLALRTGLAPNEGSVGLGWSLGSLRLDYAYLFSVGADASLGGASLPANHWFELSYAWGPSAPAERWADKAREAGRRGDWAQALWFYGNALESAPGDPALKRERDQASAQYQALRCRQYYQAGLKAQAQGSLSEARVDFQWARQANPLDPLPAAALGALDAQEPKGALADPRVQSLLAAALALQSQGRGGEALARLGQASAWYPGDASLAALRRVFEAQAPAGPARLSIQAEKKVLALQHEAEDYESQGHADLARQAWQKILAQDPDNPEARGRLAPGGAKAAGASPAQRKRSEALFNQGLSAYEGGDIRGAIQCWEQAVEADPDNLNARNNLVRARIETENSQP
jgi:tetratricopeptide (TPR) repeat protein